MFFGHLKQHPPYPQSLESLIITKHKCGANSSGEVGVSERERQEGAEYPTLSLRSSNNGCGEKTDTERLLGACRCIQDSCEIGTESRCLSSLACHIWLDHTACYLCYHHWWEWLHNKSFTARGYSSFKGAAQSVLEALARRGPGHEPFSIYSLDVLEQSRISQRPWVGCVQCCLLSMGN